MRDEGLWRSGADCSLGRVEIDRNGRVAIYCDHAEMGNGIGTALANRVAIHLGGVADEVAVARIDTFDPLGLVASEDPYTMKQAAQDIAQRNPRWVPAISSPTSASIGAHVGTTTPAAEAARVIFRFGLWPAALKLRRIAPTDSKAGQWSEARWKDGQLVMAGLPSLSLQEIAAKAHALNAITGAMTHAFFALVVGQGEVSRSPPNIGRRTSMRFAVRRGAGQFASLDRKSVQHPPTDYNRIGTSFTSLCGTAVRVEIERASGSCGLQRPTVYSNAAMPSFRRWLSDKHRAASQWALAMRCSKPCHRMKAVPAMDNGIWGDIESRAAPICRYVIWRSRFYLRLVQTKPRKGMAEVVMIPVVPALLNAIFDATGRRFQSLPVTEEMLKEVLA